MTQNDLSEMTGITQPVISRFDKNEQHRDIHLFAISRALGLKIDDLFETIPLMEDLGDYSDEPEGVEYFDEQT